MMSNIQPHCWFGPSALVKFLATWSILTSTSCGVLLVSSQCNVSVARAMQRMQSSSCGSNFNFSCPDTLCAANYDGMGGETAVCHLDNYINITVDGTDGSMSLLYTTVGAWSPGDQTRFIPSLAGEGTRVDLSGSLQGSAQITILSSKDCALQVNEQECSCEMVYCPTDQSTARVQANCTNLGQGHLDACDTITYGKPGDILSYLVLADPICAQIVSSEDGRWTGLGVPPPEEDAAPPPSTGFMERSQRQCFWTLIMAAILALSIAL